MHLPKVDISHSETEVFWHCCFFVCSFCLKKETTDQPTSLCGLITHAKHSISSYECIVLAAEFLIYAGMDVPMLMVEFLPWK